jgi:hypothetical protein
MTRLDMTMMLTLHDALRRELERITVVTARTDDDPRRILRAAVGWRMFTEYLHIHHTAEDDALWDPMAALLDDRPDDVALLAAMEAEHAAIDPLIAAVDDALADREAGHERLGGAVEALSSTLKWHLRHEEADGLPLIDDVLGAAEWADFGRLHSTRVGDRLATYLPWLLDGAGDLWTERVLSRLPAPARETYETRWQPAYAALDLWAPPKSA